MFLCLVGAAKSRRSEIPSDSFHTENVRYCVVNSSTLLIRANLHNSFPIKSGGNFYMQWKLQYERGLISRDHQDEL